MQSEQKCCPPGSWPALKVEYQPKGQFFDLHNTKVYHVGDSNKVLVIISDIFGATSARHQAVADTYADHGYNVFLPEILDKPYVGDLQLGPIIQCIKNQNWESMQARFKALYQHLHSKGHKQFYAVGFCWGVWAGFKLAAKYDGFKGFVGFHPSLGLCGVFGQSQTELTQSVKCPAYFYPAGNDPANVKEGGQLVEILAKKFGQDKTGAHTFADQVHGFVVRGDVKQENVHRDVQKALKLSLEYFAKL